jgi:hypothetical protein
MTILFWLALGTAAAAAVRGMWSPCGLSMLSSLNPVGEASRGYRFAASAGWYVAGSVAGGAILGAACAVPALGYRSVHADARLTWMLAGVAALIVLAADLGVAGFRLPVNPRQVDVGWLTAYRRWVYAGGFGLQIGLGFVTYIMTGAVYLTAVLAALTASPGAALLVGLTFGLVRGLCVLFAAPARTPERLRILMYRIVARDRASLAVAWLASAAVAVVAAQLAGGPIAGALAGTAVAALLVTVAALPQSTGVR